MNERCNIHLTFEHKLRLWQLSGKRNNVPSKCYIHIPSLLIHTKVDKNSGFCLWSFRTVVNTSTLSSNRICCTELNTAQNSPQRKAPSLDKKQKFNASCSDSIEVALCKMVRIKVSFKVFHKIFLSNLVFRHVLYLQTTVIGPLVVAFKANNTKLRRYEVSFHSPFDTRESFGSTNATCCI